MPQQAETLKSISFDISGALERIEKSLERAVVQSTALNTNTAESVRIIDGARQLLTSASSLREIINLLPELFAGFANSVTETQKTLAESSSDLKNSIKSSANILEEDLTRSTEAASLLSNRLVQVAQTIIDQTQRRQAFK